MTVFMKRKLLNQMATEWRSNVWMVIELVIVIAVLHFVFSSFYSFYVAYSHDNGYNTDDTFVADIRYMPKSSPAYVPYDSVHSTATDCEVLLGKIRNNPNVELATVASNNSVPYWPSYYGMTARLLDGDSTSAAYSANIRPVTPDLIRIYRIQGLNGETTEELARIVERGDIILSNVEPSPRSTILDPWLTLGKDVFFGNDSTDVHHVGALAWGLRRSDFEPLYGGVIYRNMNKGDASWGARLVVRVKPGKGTAFVESLSTGDKIQGNVYLTNLASVNRMREIANLNEMQEIRNFSVCAVFLLLVVFLGFLGTFWFRIQQRIGEIAVRKVAGATNTDIFSRLISEGLLLLAIAAVIATPLVVGIVRAEIHAKVGLEMLDNSAYIAGGVLTFLVLMVLIVCGIWAPARKATRIDPAYALKDQ